MNVQGLNYEQKDNRIVFTDQKTGEIVYYLEKPFMYDSFVPQGFKKVATSGDVPEAARSNDVQMKLVQRGSQLYVDVIPDRTWLEKAERVYPVVIDPTIVSYQPGSQGTDTNIRSYFPTTTGGADTTLGVGLYKDATQTNVIRSLLKFDLSSIPQGSTILNANLNLWLSSVSNDTPIGVEVHEATRSWTENGATWNTSDGTTAWTTQGGDFVSTPTATSSGIGGLTDLSINYSWNITSLVDKWNRSSSTNSGILLKSNAESTNTYKKFISSDDANNAAYRPMLAVTYYPSSRLGLESFWTYDNHALVGGQSYTNMTTGNNVVQFTDVALHGRGGMGVTFTRTYNSKAVDDSPMGYGWSYTGGETIIERWDQSQAIYTDSNGTSHLFTYNSTTGTYTPPAGTYLKLTRTTDTNGQLNGYDLTYKNGLKLHFSAKGNAYQDIISGKIQFIEDRHGNRITYGYDSSGNLTTVDAYVDSVNYRRTQFVYDTSHNMLTVIDPKGRKTDYTYSSKLVTKVQEPYGDGAQADLSTRPGTTYSYDLANFVSTATDRNGNPTTYNSNSNYVITKVTDALGRMTSYSLDDNYNPTQITDPKGNVTTNTYDNNGNVTTTLDPEGHQVTSTYDAYSNLTSVTDALGRKTTYDYSTTGDLLTVTNPLLQKTTYTYDSYGNRTSKTDGNGNKTTYGYDANGINQTSITDAASQVTTMEYDSADNVTKITEPNGHVTTQQYNWLGELTNMDEKASATDTNSVLTYHPTYDSNGNIQKVDDTVNGVTKTTNYDLTATNDVQSQTVQSTQQIQYQYDNNQNMTAWTPQTGWGRGLQFTYDTANQLKQVKDSSTVAVLEDYSYDLNGNVTSIQRTDADGVTQSMTYDKANRLTNLQNVKGTTTLSSFSYTLDANGRITAVTDDKGATKNYTYDEVGRLNSYTDSTGTTNYTFDAVGNRLTKTAPNGTTSYTYNNLN